MGLWDSLSSVGDWFVGAGETLAGGVDDTFRQDQVTPYEPNRENFRYGGSQEASDRNRAFLGAQGAGRGREAVSAQGRGGVQIDPRQAAQAYRMDQEARALGMQDRQRALASREGQLGSLGQMQGALKAGPGPSAAQAQLAQGQDAQMRQALALSGSGRGGGGASALRSAMEQNAATGQQTNQAAGLMRAQEGAAFRNQQLGQMAAIQQGYQGMRQGDAGLMQADAGMRGLDQSRVGLAQQGAQAQAGLSMQQRALNDQYSLGMGQQQLSYEQLRQMQGMGELQAGQNYEQQRGGAQMGAQYANTGYDAQRDQSMLGMGSAALGALAMSSDKAAKEEARQEGMSAMYRALGGSRTPGQEGLYRAQMERKAGEAMRPWTAERQASEAMRPVQGYSYDYKNPKGPAEQGRQYGVMAQDLEKTPAGASTVFRGPDGMRRVDTNKLTMLNTAALAEQQRLIDALHQGGGAGGRTVQSDEAAKDKVREEAVAQTVRAIQPEGLQLQTDMNTGPNWGPGSEDFKRRQQQAQDFSQSYNVESPSAPSMRPAPARDTMLRADPNTVDVTMNAVQPAATEMTGGQKAGAGLMQYGMNQIQNAGSGGMSQAQLMEVLRRGY
jgi:hypothetical protein